MSTAVAQQRSKLKSGPSTSALLDELEDAVEQIIRAVAEFEHPESAPVDDAWTVKDTLGHIAFWHDSFARNVAALTDGRKPDVLKGTYPDLNARGIASMGLHLRPSTMRSFRSIVITLIMLAA